MTNKFFRSAIVIAVSSFAFTGCMSSDSSNPTPEGPQGERQVRKEDITKAIADQGCDPTVLKIQSGVFETKADYSSDELTAKISYRITVTRDNNTARIDHLLLDQKSLEISQNQLSVNAQIASDAVNGVQIESIKYPTGYQAPHSVSMVSQKLSCKIVEKDSQIPYNVSPTKYYLVDFYAGGTAIPGARYNSFKEGRLICNGKDLGKGRIETDIWKSIVPVGTEGLSLGCDGQELAHRESVALEDGTFVERYDQRVLKVISVQPSTKKPAPTTGQKPEPTKK